MNIDELVSFDEKKRRWVVENAFASRSFGVGDAVTESEGGLLGAEGLPHNPYRLPLGFVATTLDDAKRMALAFAWAISGADGELAVRSTKDQASTKREG